MCTVILSIEQGAPLLLAGVRDELADRAWEPPGWHWPDFPGLIGGRDLLAGGTWLAVAPASRRVACVLNGRGRMAPAASRRTRGTLPLRVASGGTLDAAPVAGVDPFHLVSADPGGAVLWTWDGEHLSRRELPAGLHVIVNSGLSGDLLTGGAPAGSPADGTGATAPELARIAHFLPLLHAAARPAPQDGGPVAEAWGEWLPLLNGDGIAPGDERALIVRRELGDGRAWGTTSISLVALTPQGCRYDFTGVPGDPRAWCRVSTGARGWAEAPAAPRGSRGPVASDRHGSRHTPGA